MSRRRASTGLRTVHAPWRAGHPFVRVRPQGGRRDRPPAAADRAARARAVRAAAAVRRRLRPERRGEEGAVRRPAGSIYEDLHDSYKGELAEFIHSEGMVASEDEARAQLAAGKVDIVVVFPPQPAGVGARRQARRDQGAARRDRPDPGGGDPVRRRARDPRGQRRGADDARRRCPVASSARWRELSTSLQQASQIARDRSGRNPRRAEPATGGDRRRPRRIVEHHLPARHPEPELVGRVEAAREQASDIVTRLEQRRREHIRRGARRACGVDGRSRHRAPAVGDARPGGDRAAVRERHRRTSCRTRSRRPTTSRRRRSRCCCSTWR